MLNGHSNLGDVVGFVIGIINIIIPVLTLLALVLVLYAALRYVLKAEESKGKGPERSAILWGLISLFVIVSVWGILRIMCQTLFNSSSCQGVSTSSINTSEGTSPTLQSGILY
jgi:hypothetical protein